jgi:uncharacterized protein YoxC
METTAMILAIGGFVGTIMITVIGYFLNRTIKDLDKAMEELKDVKQISFETKSKLAVIENEYTLKHSHLSEKFDELCSTVKDLTIEIKQLNIELLKKK